MSKKQRNIIIVLVITLLLIAIAVIAIMLLSSNKNQAKDPDKTSKYELIQSEMVTLAEETIGGTEDFIYFYDYPANFYGEYDVKKDELIQLPIKNYIGCLNFYEGYLYAVCLNNDKRLTISKIDVNTGNYEEIYVTPPDVDGLYNFTMSKSGLMFFNERRPTSEVKYGEYVENEDGFMVNYRLYMYNPETKEKTPLVEGAEMMYYIRGNRLYFKRVHKTLQEVVYYIDIENPEKVVDTGIVCRTLDAVRNDYTGYFYVDYDGKYIYYSGGTNEYKRKNIETGEEEVVFTYKDSKGYITEVNEFNGKHIVYVRCTFDNEVEVGAKLFEIDVETGDAKLIWEDNIYELLNTHVSFKGNNDYFFFWTYPASTVPDYQNVGQHYYLMYKDGTRKMIFDDNEIWNAATLNRKG